ncbi:MAG: ISKra4 family transposase, partial [Planctomycetaceae bacterium]|nr:ISKra4 family transposase [Planctomycetaceae bacterium]
MMSISGTFEACNSDPAQIVNELKDFVSQAVSDEIGMRDFERGLFDRLLAMGSALTEEFLRKQGNGDCGETCEVAEKTAYRSEKPAVRRLRTIFGEHQFEAFVYRSGKHPNSRIVARPVGSRLGIDTQQYSPLLQEITMTFCCEQAFHVGAETFETVFNQKLSVDTLERTSRVLGKQAAEFLDSLSNPPEEEEGELLVHTADGKGVPM